MVDFYILVGRYEKYETLLFCPFFGNTQTSAVSIIIHTGKVTTDASVVPATAVVANFVSV